ncbi:MAG: hypothetical protein IPI43_27090 [Sandaracinaceae bacterium]|nr:hypothetical protein [Sandaracinaceae bacterium]
MRAPAPGSIFVLALVGALAVPVTHAQTTPAQPLAMLEPDQVHLGGSNCTASVPRELGRSSVRNLRLRVASQPGPRPSTLAVWSSGEHTVASRRIDRELGALNTVALDQGLNVQVLAPVNGGRFLVLSVGALCSGGRTRGYSCVRAIGLDADGMPTGAAHAPEPSTQQFDVVSSATLRGVDGAPSGVAVATVSRWGGASIDLFRLDPGGRVMVEEHPIRTQGPSDYPIELLTADGEQVVALGSQDGPATDEEGVALRRSFVLALGQRRHVITRTAPASARLSWARARGADLDLFYTMPRGDVRWLRVSGGDGSFLDGTPTTLAPTAELPATPVFPALAVTRGSLTLTRTDLRGAAVGQPLVMARVAGRAITSWSWDGSALHVVWGARVGREWVISESSVTCSAAL